MLNVSTRPTYFVALGFLSCLFLADRVIGQTTDARIVGTVSDTSGAAVPNAKVQARNLGTNETQSGVTSERGEYVMTNLLIGSYEVSVEHAGFKRYVRGPIQLSVEQTARVEIVMEVGAVSEIVKVTSSAPLIETDRSSMGKVMEAQTMVQLPLSGRNFVDLAYLLPGTVQSGRGSGLSVNGSRTEHNNFMLDGVDNNEAIAGTVAITPSIDALEEFKVQTANYSAEYGRADGAVVNVAIKSGTNSFHGVLFEFLRNDLWDANDFFTNYYGRDNAPLRRNQFGFSFGGPAIRNKTFFFANYEGYRERRAGTSSSLVPTAALRSGDFSGLPTLYDPASLNPQGARLAFPGNRIPSSRFNPISVRLFDRWPLPNSAVELNRYVENFSDRTDRNQYHIRVDHHLTSTNRLMVRVSSTKQLGATPTIAYNDTANGRDSQGGVATWTSTISPSIINELRFGATTWIQNNGHLYPYEDHATKLGLPNFGATGWHPGIGVGGYTGIAGAQPLSRRENSFQWIDQFTVIKGRHTMKMGVDIRRYQTNNYQPQFGAGNYSFNGAFTATKGQVYPNGFGDFLLGLPLSQRILNPSYSDSVRLRNTRMGLYIQDDFNILPRLTLNLGMRWERDGSLTELRDRWGYFDPAAGQLVYPESAKIPFKLPYSHRFQKDAAMTKPTNRNFAPRIGMAWRPFGDTKTSVRAAYGIFFGNPIVLMSLNSIFNLPPFALLSVFASSGSVDPELQFGVFPGVSAEQFIPARPAGIFTFDPYDFRSPYVQQWNFGIEREIAKDLAIKTSYVGSKGTHLERRHQLNPALPPAPGPIDPRRRYPGFGDIQWQETSASSSYHSLQLSAEKRASDGLWFLGAYTWGKMIDDSSSWGDIGGTSQYAQDPTRLYLERSLSGHDVRSRFSLAFFYAVPVHTRHRWAKPLVQGWEASGIVTLQTGSPLTPSANNAITNAQTLTTRGSVIGKVNLDPSERTIDRWFNTSALVNPTQYTFGTAGRNIIDGPGDRSFDFSMMKVFSVTERHRLQFRAEFYNFFNHPNFGNPNTTVQNVAFGTIRGGGAGREMQFALKYIF